MDHNYSERDKFKKTSIEVANLLEISSWFELVELFVYSLAPLLMT